MADADGPRLADEADLRDVHELVELCFHFERGGATACLPFCYDDEHPELHPVICADGRVVAHAAAIPQTFAVGDRNIETVGISCVATDPRHRGNGYMSDLLSSQLDRIATPMVHLGGDWQRYGHFGFQTVS